MNGSVTDQSESKAGAVPDVGAGEGTTEERTAQWEDGLL